AGWVGGFVGAVAMTLLMKMGTSMGMSNMPPMPVIQGAMFTDDEGTARKIGMFTHLIMMGTLVFGTTYAALFASFGTASWLTGVLIGLVHAVVAGAIGFPMMGSAHPRMESPATFTHDVTYRSEPGALRIASPGFFGVNYGSGTPMGLLMGHAVYGLAVALVYNGFA
ncbi:MAG: hypothetical protein KY469_21025, partial [Actinobacteria bacterium]|nr:hypothetical protein [Actinomycetota bacterium]